MSMNQIIREAHYNCLILERAAWVIREGEKDYRKVMDFSMKDIPDSFHMGVPTLDSIVRMLGGDTGLINHWLS